MKKKTRIQPLQLSRETILQLDSQKLASIEGGLVVTTVPHTFSALVPCLE